MFFYIMAIILILILILSFSKIGIKIENIKLSTEKIKGRHLNINYKITVSLYILNKIRLLKINITKAKLEKLKVKSKMKDFNVKLIKNRNNLDKKTFIALKNIKPKIEYINFRLDIGVDDAAITSYIVAIISTILGILLRNQSVKEQEKNFIVNPLYINKNLLYLELNCIFTIKMIHIIYIIYILKRKRRDDKNERTSNRRTYGYGYE